MLIILKNSKNDDDINLSWLKKQNIEYIKNEAVLGNCDFYSYYSYVFSLLLILLIIFIIIKK